MRSRWSNYLAEVVITRTIAQVCDIYCPMVGSNPITQDWRPSFLVLIRRMVSRPQVYCISHHTKQGRKRAKQSRKTLSFADEVSAATCPQKRLWTKKDRVLGSPN